MSTCYFSETEKALSDLEEFLRGNRAFEGIKTGFETIDTKTGGLKNGDLILLGGRPGMGKTSFALKLIENASVDGKHTTVFFSLGQNKLNVFQKILEQMTGKRLPVDEAVSEEEYSDNLETALQELKHSPLLIEDDRKYASAAAIKARCNEIQEKTRIELLIIDYLQLMTGEKPNDVDNICDELKKLATELDCPVLLLTQIGRECEYRVDHRPMLSDLPGDIYLESLADEIVLLYRDDYYDMYSDYRGKVELEIAKHPSAPKYTIYLNWSDINQMRGGDYIVGKNRKKTIPGIDAIVEEMNDQMPMVEDTFMLATNTLDGALTIRKNDDSELTYALELSDGEGDAMVSVDFTETLDRTFFTETYLQLNSLLEGTMKTEYMGISWGRIEFLLQNGGKAPSADTIIYLEEREEYAGDGSYLRIQLDRETLVDLCQFFKGYLV